MKLDSIHPALQAALGIHEALRRMGFLANNIYLHLSENKLSVVIRTSGQDFGVQVGDFEKSQEDLQCLWSEVATAYNDNLISPEDQLTCLHTGLPPERTLEFVKSMLRAGIRIPGKTSN